MVRAQDCMVTDESWVRIMVEPLRNFFNSVFPALPVSFGGDTKSCWSLLSGVLARGSKTPHTRSRCVTYPNYNLCL